MHAKFTLYVKLVKRTIPTSLPSVLILFGALYILSTHQVSARSAGPVESVVTTDPQRQPSSADAAQMLPISLTIADLGIHLDLKQGAYDARSNQWTIDDHAAYITTQSATPIIYAHNRPALFAPLRSIEAGMTMTLTWSDSTTVSYRYTKTRFVSPDDGQILREVNDKTIILLTCNGFFDESRRLVYFEEQS